MVFVSSKLKYLNLVLALAFIFAQPAVFADDKARSWGGLQFLGPNTLADIAEQIAPSVVNIDVSITGQAQNPVRDKVDSKTKAKSYEHFYKYFGVTPPAGGEGGSEGFTPPRGTGSGVILKPDGIILTSNHLIQSGDRIKVTLRDGRTFIASLLGHDVFSDLAVVKINATDLPTVKFGSTADLRPGDWVLAIGSPLGLDHTVTLGIISALGREAKTSELPFGARSGAVHFIQTDAAINPGNSGGPLVNLKGEVIGINTFIRGDAQNIGFAIPSDMAADVASKLMRFQEIPHPYIGIVMDDTDSAAGVKVASVAPKGPAATAGMLSGDVIVEMNGSPVLHSDQVSIAIRDVHIGDYVAIKVKRNGGEKQLKVQVDQLPDESNE
jgi:S1-C subfamily serine protease